MKSERQADQAWVEETRARNLAATAPPVMMTLREEVGPCPACSGLRVVPHPQHAVWVPCRECAQ